MIDIGIIRKVAKWISPKNADDLSQELYLWYFEHEDETQTLYCKAIDIIRSKKFQYAWKNSKAVILLDFANEDIAEFFEIGDYDTESKLYNELQVQQIFDSISPQNREILYRKFFLCEPDSEVASNTGLKVDTMRKRIQTIKKEFRSII
jgi:DNA-directed RNA polymerase specialized sigma24 family protein